MRIKTQIFAIAVAVLHLVSVAHAQKLSLDVSLALNWMPPQSETLAVARGPVTLPNKDAKNRQGWRDWPVTTPYFSISNLQLSAIAPNLAGRVIESSLETRANFRPPAGFGLMPYDGCGVVRLRPLRGETRAALQTKVLRGASKIMVIAGHRTSVFEEKRENDLWRTYVVVPRDNLVILATDRTFLKTVLARMERKTVRNRAFPTSWDGWKLVNTAAPFWAVRRLDLAQSVGVLGPHNKDPKASALVIYQTGPPQKPSLVFKYRSSNLRYGQLLFDAMKNEIRSGFNLKIVARDLTQITLPGEAKAQPMMNFFVIGFLGTAIYV